MGGKVHTVKFVLYLAVPGLLLVPTTSLGAWSAINDIGSGQIQYIDTISGYRIIQNTSDNFYTCGEVDLWLMAVAPLPDVSVVQPGVLSMTSQPYTLQTMSSLNFTWTEKLISASHGTRCGNGQDLASMIGAIYFRNIVNGQTFQYQVVTSDTRGFRPIGSWFGNAPSGAFIAVSDNIADTYGGAYLIPGGSSIRRSINVLPRAKEMLAAAPNANVDKDFSHWKIVMVIVGSYVNGAGQITADISGVNVVADGNIGISNLLTDPGLTDKGAFIVRPIELGSYILQGPLGNSLARWAFLTDGIGSSHQFPIVIATPTPTPTPTPTVNPTPTSSPSQCGLITASHLVPDGFASPLDVVSDPTNNMMKMSCSPSNQVSISLGNGSQFTYIYKIGYAYRAGRWQQISYSGTNLKSNAWYPANATGSLNLSEVELQEGVYVVSYQCSWTGVWKCGCLTNACNATANPKTGGLWQVQLVRQ
jgi:hypothetical protein